MEEALNLSSDRLPDDDDIVPPPYGYPRFFNSQP